MVWITCGPGRRFSVIDRVGTPGRQLPSGAVSLRPGALLAATVARTARLTAMLVPCTSPGLRSA